MKVTFLEYLKNISLTEILTNKIERVISECESFCPEEILNIFVNEYIKEDGIREYESLWLFSENCVMEAKQFPIQDDYDLAPLKNHIIYIEINKQYYEFRETTEKSRLKIDFTLDNKIVGVLKGSKENCFFLTEVFRKYILPNFKK